MEQEREWFARLAANIGSRVASFRKGQGLTAQAVADQCAKLGHPLDRSVIAKLEKGYRLTVTVADILVLARALNVPPVLLIYPLGDAGTVEALPGQERPTWPVVKWFSGRSEFPGDPEVTWAPAAYHETHERKVEDWRWEQAQVSVVEDALSRAKSDEAREAQRDRLTETLKRLAERERDLADLRQAMRTQFSMIPPPLPDGLAEAIGERQFIVYERADSEGRIRERRTVTAGSEDDHLLLRARSTWRALDLPFKEPPGNFNLDEQGDGHG